MRNFVKKQEGKTSRKSKEKERDRGTEGETSYPDPGTDALIGDEEENVKQMKEKQERNSEQPPTQLPWTITTYSGLF